jgi:hypothetical protein
LLILIIGRIRFVPTLTTKLSNPLKEIRIMQIQTTAAKNNVSVAGTFSADAIFEDNGEARELQAETTEVAESAEAVEALNQNTAPKQIPHEKIFGTEAECKENPHKFSEPFVYDPATDKTVLAFHKMIAQCEDKGGGYRDALNETLAIAYKAFYQYEERAGKYAKETIFAWLKDCCEKKKYEYTEGKTKAEHMILQLTFGEMTTATKSQRARLFRLAYSKAEMYVMPDRFLSWLKGKGGVVNALKPKNPKSSATLTTERQHRKSALRLKVRTYVLGEVKNILVKDLPPVSDKSLALAVIERNSDGTFTVLGFTDDEFAVDTACSAYGKTMK